MDPTEIVLEGTIQGDGTLVLDKQPPLPAGRVQVTLQPLAAPRKRRRSPTAAESVQVITEGTAQKTPRPGRQHRSRGVQIVEPPPPEPPESDPFWQMMESIWARQKARGHVPRSTADVERELQEIRGEWEGRQQRLERLQKESRRPRVKKL